MRRMFKALPAASLLLCLATCALWARSYWYYDIVQVNRPTWRTISSFKGRLYLAGSDETQCSFPLYCGFPVDWRNPRAGGPIYCFDYPDRDVTLLRWAGKWGPPTRWFTSGYSYAGAPMWEPASLLMILPAIALWRRWRRTAARGQCATCGYDLRATPDRCPECGAVATVIV